MDAIFDMLYLQHNHSKLPSLFPPIFFLFPRTYYNEIQRCGDIFLIQSKLFEKRRFRNNRKYTVLSHLIRKAFAESGKKPYLY